MKTGWWYRASTEERLAQIDAGIELGMTAKQVAMNCGCLYESASVASGGQLVTQLARRNGRRFPEKYSDVVRNTKISRTKTRPKRLAEAKGAYLAGEPVDFWGVQ